MKKETSSNVLEKIDIAKERIEVKMLGTPLTHQRFLNTKNGSYGPALSCLLYTSPSPRDRTRSRMPSSA